MSLSSCYWEDKTHNQVERETQHNVPSMTIARNIITLSTDLTNSNTNINNKYQHSQDNE